MTPDVLNALVNMGSAGAVIAVVIIFLKSIRERDAEWRSFFTAINSDSKDDVRQLAVMMERMVSSLDKHDETVNERVVKRLERIESNTQPRTQTNKGSSRGAG